MQRGLLDIADFIVPTGVLRDTLQFLRVMGAKGCEGFVLWGGRIVDRQSLRFHTVIIPDQEASITQRGLLVTVTGETLFQVNKKLYESGSILAAQIHSHPTEAYHSSTDDKCPLATLVGALSLVIPYFARRAPADLDEWAWYQLSAAAKWEPLSDNITITFE